MGHCIHAIIAPSETAERISTEWPELPRLDLSVGFAIFPVDHRLIDARISPDTTPTSTGDEFMLLTDGFRNALRQLSRNGLLAFVETEYFGGSGGQGILVFQDGNELMEPTWAQGGTINHALDLIGVKRPLFGDRFGALGLDQVRSNEAWLDMIEASTQNNDDT